MKLKYISAAVLAIILLALFATIVVAQSAPPSPYAGIKNPFDWSDTQAQAAGKNIYQQKCGGCHGPSGAGIPQFNFSSSAYSQKLEAQPDFYFWVISEGRLDKGMPPYKSSLSEEQRWQTLTYVHSLGAALSVPAASAPSAPPNNAAQGNTLTLLASHEAKSGDNLTFTALLKDAQNKPISDAEIKFFLTEDFFAQGPMEIGQATTDSQGLAVLNYVARKTGEQSLMAKYQTLESESKINILDSGQTFYQTDVGIHLPSSGPEVFVGPDSSHQLSDMATAPFPALRLPGGLFSWLWLYIGVVVLVWGIYFIIMFQTLRISGSRDIPVTNRKYDLAPAINTRLIPVLGLVVVVGLGILIVFMIITGPYTQFHLVP